MPNERENLFFGAILERLDVGNAQATINGTNWASRADTFTTTANGVTVNASTRPVSKYSATIKGTGAVPTTLTGVLEVSNNGTDFETVLAFSELDDGKTIFSIADSPALYFRTRVSALTLGSATNVIVTILGME